MVFDESLVFVLSKSHVDFGKALFDGEFLLVRVRGARAVAELLELDFELGLLQLQFVQSRERLLVLADFGKHLEE